MLQTITLTKTMPDIWQTCSNCGKLNHIKGSSGSVPERGRKVAQRALPTHEVKNNEESWHNSDDKKKKKKKKKHIDAVTIKSFSFNSLKPVIKTKLEMSS